MRTSKFLGKIAFSTGKVLPGRLFLGLALGASLGAFGLAGCHSNSADTTNPADSSTASTDPNATDPTAANMAPVDNSTQVAGVQQEATPSQESYSNAAPAPVERRRPSSSTSESAPSQLRWQL